MFAVKLVSFLILAVIADQVSADCNGAGDTLKKVSLVVSFIPL